MISTNLQRRENFIFNKGMSLEQEKLTEFICNLDKENILIEDYSRIVKFYENKMEIYTATKTNEVVGYITAVLVPSILTVMFNGNEEKSMLYLIMIGFGTFVVPGVILLVNSFTNRKKYLYSGIVYYLKLFLQIEDYNKEIESRKK